MGHISKNDVQSLQHNITQHTNIMHTVYKIMKIGAIRRYILYGTGPCRPFLLE